MTYEGSAAVRRAADGSSLTRVDGRPAAPSRRMTSVLPPACGGLCRLKPAFQAVPATLGLSIPTRTFMPGGVCRLSQTRVTAG